MNQSVDFTGKIHDRDNLFDNFFMNKHTSDNLYDNFFMPNLNQYSAKNCVKQDRYLEVHSTFTTKLTLLHRTQVPTETSLRIRVKFHVSSFRHALPTVDIFYSFFQIIPDLIETNLFQPVWI